MQPFVRAAHRKADDLSVLLVISHMRAGTSLLSHLLASNPEIVGVGEMHLTYDSAKDLHDRLPGLVMWHTKQFRLDHERYVMDKVVHNKLLPADRLSALPAEGVRTLFLVRDPGATVASLQKSLGLPEADARSYLAGRYEMLSYLAARSPESPPPLAIRFSELLNDTASVFQAIESYLGLDTPLEEQYETDAKTGVTGFGDPGPNIQSGRIVRDRDTPATPHVPDDDPLKLQFDRCLEAMTDHCTRI